jgi:hypothetical protein
MPVAIVCRSRKPFAKPFSEKANDDDEERGQRVYQDEEESGLSGRARAVIVVSR